MSKTLYNLDHHPVVINHEERAVSPGDSYTFTDEQVKAGIAGTWSENNPRAFRPEKRSAPPEVPADTDPVEPGDKEQP